jgi:hypothetical protein
MCRRSTRREVGQSILSGGIARRAGNRPGLTARSCAASGAAASDRQRLWREFLTGLRSPLSSINRLLTITLPGKWASGIILRHGNCRAAFRGRSENKKRDMRETGISSTLPLGGHERNVVAGVFCGNQQGFLEMMPDAEPRGHDEYCYLPHRSRRLLERAGVGPVAGSQRGGNTDRVIPSHSAYGKRADGRFAAFFRRLGAVCVLGSEIRRVP